MSVPSSCVKCGGVMEEGFILDMTDSGFRVSEWVMGAPVRQAFGLPKAERQDRFRTRTFACMSCGYMESYLTLKEE